MLTLTWSWENEHYNIQMFNGKNNRLFQEGNLEMCIKNIQTYADIDPMFRVQNAE
jgi:hypothetical protein